MKLRTALALNIFVCIFGFSCGSASNSALNTTPDKTSLPTPASNVNVANSNTNMTNTANTAVMQDAFWSEAAQSGMAEVELSQLAAEKAQNAEVKRFAQMMVTDHGKANSELKALAAKKNIVLPTTLSSSHQSKLEELRGLSGAEFDREYVETMVEDHEAAVELFREQAEDDDTAMADVKAFAAKTLPTLQKHLESIKGIQAKMK